MNKTEQSIIQSQNGPGIKRFLRQLFCKHTYEIGILVGLGFKYVPGNIVAKDGAEIMCFCSKCRKKFISVISTTDGRIVKQGEGLIDQIKRHDFLHNHPMEEKLKLDVTHVIVDRKDWEIARAIITTERQGHV